MPSKPEIDNLFSPVETQRASEAIYTQIRKLILDGKLAPGDRLPSERKMMELFHRSRTSIREALRMLEREGFIRTIAGSRGAVVQALSAETVESSLEAVFLTGNISLEELSEYRHITEICVARWAALRRSDSELAALREILDASRAQLADYRQFISLDTKFHAALALAAHNRVSYVMTQVLTNLIKSTLNTHMSAMPDNEKFAMCVKILAMHEDIYAAIVSSDPDAAAAAMAQHVDAFLLDLKD